MTTATHAESGPPAYDDAITRQFVLASVLWGAVGMTVGVIIALQLAWWPANGSVPWLSFGRLRPLHTNAVIFAFACNVIFAGMYYSVPRLLKTPMWSRALLRNSSRLSRAYWMCRPMPRSTFPSSRLRRSCFPARR